MRMADGGRATTFRCASGPARGHRQRKPHHLLVPLFLLLVVAPTIMPSRIRKRRRRPKRSFALCAPVAPIWLPLIHHFFYRVPLRGAVGEVVEGRLQSLTRCRLSNRGEWPRNGRSKTTNGAASAHSVPWRARRL